MVSPYYLHPSDNPGALITPVQLTGVNYAEWATELENALRAKRKTGFIDGTLKMPTGKPEEEESWKTVNSMIVGWIRGSMSPTIRSTVTFTADAHKLWTDLKKRYSVGNAVRLYQLKAELAACKQGGASVMEYFSRLTQKWDELINCKPGPLCTCSAASTYEKNCEDEKVYQFLMGLDDSRFGNICTNIIGMETLPDLNTVYQRVIREEGRLTAYRSDTKQEALGFAARTESNTAEIPSMQRYTQSSRTSLTCIHVVCPK